MPACYLNLAPEPNGSGGMLESISLRDDQLRSADCGVIVTDHSSIDYARICHFGPLVVDARKALNGDPKMGL